MIESTQNKHIKRLIGLQKNKKNRNKEKVFIVEGIKLVEEVQEDWEIDSIFVAASFKQENPSFLNQIALHRNLSENVSLVSDKIFNAVSDTMTPQDFSNLQTKNIFVGRNSICSKWLLYYLRRCSGSWELRAIIRTGSFGSDSFSDKGTVDLYNPKVIRSTMGSIFIFQS